MEAIPFPGCGTKTPNFNTQITNNIKITNSNDQNISFIYLKPAISALFLLEILLEMIANCSLIVSITLLFMAGPLHGYFFYS